VHQHKNTNYREIMEFVTQCVISNPDIRKGLPTLKGTRLSVSDVLSIYQNDELDDYPEISYEMLLACLSYVKIMIR
jgi:uncharacterized protein (DUF433 family)